MVSPLTIEIALHYWTRPGDFPRSDAPACHEIIEEFKRRGLLVDSEHVIPHGGQYCSTDGLRVWIEAMCAVPYPEQRWVIPSHPMTRTEG